MREKIIEPSEIIIDGSGLPREDTSRPNPWVRLLARFFDYSLFFIILWLLRSFFHGNFPLGKFEHLIPFEFFVWIPIEAFLLATWGTTPGKFFLKIGLRQGRKSRLDFTTAIRRSFNVWFRGLGMGIPVVNFFCLLVAFQRLRIFRQTSWDREENIIVTHSPIGRWRIVIAATLAIGSFLFYYTDKSDTMQAVKKNETR